MQNGNIRAKLRQCWARTFGHGSSDGRENAAKTPDLASVLAHELSSASPLALQVLKFLSIAARQRLHGLLSEPKKTGISGSKLVFHVHTVTEDSRVRKFKEPWTIDWLKSVEPESVIYDVGANIGITALTAAEDSTRMIRVVAIEPFPEKFA